MHVSLITVGKLKRGPEKELADDYADRFAKTGAGLGFRSFKLIEVASGGGLDAEGERIAAKVPAGTAVIRLDEFGPQLTSKALSKDLAKRRDSGLPHLCFLIGGAEGYSDAIRAAYPETLALGPQTWPHRLVRVMICEQLYRAASLLAGTPYHKA
ncbi:23S rRNA (pseudouridine(1915)-N(3))-methyltransferase RlmH [Hyphomonas sp. FCG-A18]|jgi:23S rRNA (pseudouridine1915-N3)-methyltransferase|uniref:23S rRNA (pseudouridine(1915)-N(3))-methyltransferase RlmH n=1 Tax=Hyphomonas sp. FCG-A18 TaxID=3080019 RepID=UPI002B2F93BB|nr:23S rRNA (pseudouridine(1915)-N(3))-methyltransferase RlmH [Hyphomonas sp. FCG-A18]